MNKIFYLPDLGEGLPDAEIHQWFVKEGDTVAIDQPIVAMETAKAVVDVPSPEAGIVSKIHGKVGDVIAVGAALVEFASNSDKNSPKADQDAGTVVGAIENSEALWQEQNNIAKPQVQQAKRHRIAPALRALAKKLNVDINSLEPNAQGNITAAMISAAGKQQASNTQSSSSPNDGQLSSTRRFMAENISKIHQETVPVTLFDDAATDHWSKTHDKTVAIIQAIVSACEQVPILNAHFHSNPMRLLLQHDVRLGIAMDAKQGLFVPVINDVAKISASTIRQQIEQYKMKAESNHFSPADLKNPSIILSNFGSISGRYATPMLVPPAIAIIGIGKRYQQAVVKDDGKLANRAYLPISLTFDHRAATGGDAARFLKALINAL